MTTQSQAAPDVAQHGRSAALWAGVLGAPAVWAVQLQTGYSLTEWVCHSERYFVLHLVTLVFVLLAAGGGALSWMDWKKAGRGSPDETDGGPVARTRFLGALGMVISVLFVLLIIAQGLASFFFHACPE
jgi:uncharacterized membrane protein YidH (DUF202 family)